MKFSVILLCYRCADTVQAAVESVLNQTWQDVELLCVDDCSDDDTVSLLSAYESDSRFRLLRHEENRGSSVSRRTGMREATGDYVLFLDGDDTLVPHACETLAKVLTRKPCDILQFGTELVARNEFSALAREGLEEYLTVPTEPLSGKEILTAAFQEESLSFTIWNKCYAASLIRTVASLIRDDYINMCDDYYFSLLTMSHADSFMGVTDKLIRYSIGGGISTRHRLTEEQFRRFIASQTALLACEAFARDNKLPEAVREAIGKRREVCVFSSLEKLRVMAPGDRASCARALLEQYGTDYVLDVALKKYLGRPDKLADIFPLDEMYPVTRREIRTVALLYHRLYNGGVERVLSLMSRFLTQAGYQVVLITDEPASTKDYPLAEGVTREVLSGEIPADYETLHGRTARLREILERHQVDAVINNAWVSLSLFWDMAVVKATGAAFVNYCHGTFITALNNGIPIVSDNYRIGGMADAVVTLSHADSLYWGRVNRRVFQVTNPVTFSLETTPAAPLDSHRILWLGRADSPDKNPRDAILIFKKVLECVPDATLSMVGYISPSLRRDYEKFCQAQGVAGHVEFPGYSTAVADYFQRSAVLLQTSNFESFCMSIMESLASGVPVVCYEMPYLTVCRDSVAVTQVKWKDNLSAAEAITRILTEEDTRHALGQAARSEAKRLENVDHVQVWRNILDSLLLPLSGEETGAIDRRDFADFMDEYGIVARQMCSAIRLNGDGSSGLDYCWEEPLFTNAQVTEMLQKVYDSKRYRIGKAILFLPTKIATAVRILFLHGPGYMLRVAREKLFPRK